MIHVYVYISEGVITYKNTWNFSHQTVKYVVPLGKERRIGERGMGRLTFLILLCVLLEIPLINFAVLLFLAKSIWTNSEPLSRSLFPKESILYISM